MLLRRVGRGVPRLAPRAVRPVDELNDAWGTAFWGQHHTSFDQVLPPRMTTTTGNPGQQLDFDRFTSDEFVTHLRAEADVLHEVTPHLPVTTNYMVIGQFNAIDYAAMTPHLDLVANDHYLWSQDPEAWADLAFSADRTRGLAQGGPWLLMEHSTSAVNWQGRNLAKGPGEMLRDSLAHVARGADGVVFFQWRAARAGAEKYHSAMVPHAGPDSALFRDVVALGATIGRLAEVHGSVVEPARVALLWDTQSWWAAERDAHPTSDLRYLDQAQRLHRALLDAGVAVDVLPVGAPLDATPSCSSRPSTSCDDAAAQVAAVAERGGHVLVTYFSGIVDEQDRCGSAATRGRSATCWVCGSRSSRRCAEGGAVTPVRRCDGPGVDRAHDRTGRAGPGHLRRRPVGRRAGRDTSPSRRRRHRLVRLDAPGPRRRRARLVDDVLAGAGVRPVAATVPGVEVVRRVGDGTSWLFAINHTDRPVAVPYRARPADGFSTAVELRAGRERWSGRGHPGSADVRLCRGGLG